MSEKPTHDVFLDTETGGLRHDDKVWEVGAVVDRPSGVQTRDLIHVYGFDAAAADPKALQMGGFFERHPQYAPAGSMYATTSGMDPDVPVTEGMASSHDLSMHLEKLVRGARIVVCNAVFDVPRLTVMMAEHGIPWTGHYRVVCATTYAAGVLGVDPSMANADIGAILGVDREAHGKAHNALVDALYARDLYLAALTKAGIDQRNTWAQAPVEVA